MKTGTLLESSVESGRNRVIYTITDSSGRINGPFVDLITGDPTEFVNAKAQMFIEHVDYYVVLQQAIDSTAGAGSYDKLREELKNLGVKSVRLGDVTMNVTFPNQTDPEDTRAELKSRVDADLAPGKLDQIAAVLKSAGFADAVLERENVINL